VDQVVQKKDGQAPMDEALRLDVHQLLDFVLQDFVHELQNI
jgi:hypothetical protein